MKCVPWQAGKKRFFNQVFQRNSQSFQSKIPFWLEEGAKTETLIKKTKEYGLSYNCSKLVGPGPS